MFATPQRKPFSRILSPPRIAFSGAGKSLKMASLRNDNETPAAEHDATELRRSETSLIPTLSIMRKVVMVESVVVGNDVHPRSGSPLNLALPLCCWHSFWAGLGNDCCAHAVHPRTLIGGSTNLTGRVSGRHARLPKTHEAMAKFHTYSFGNIMLIARQKPDATNVAGLRTWNSLGRFVRRGEKGIFILAPMVGRRSTKDAATDEPSEDTTTEGQRTLYGFPAVYVFDRLSRDLRLSLCALDVCRECHFKELPRSNTSSLNSSQRSLLQRFRLSPSFAH